MSAPSTSSSYSNEEYTVGWICAISTEYVAAQEHLDEEHGRPQFVSVNDNNDYTLGKVGEHNVVIAVLPDHEYGTSSAASVARDMLHSFPNVRIGLMVGIAGGAPSPKHDIRLGDVVVSVASNGKGGVFQYDFGKRIQQQDFQETGFLNQPPHLLRAAVNGLRALYMRKGHRFEKTINVILEKNPRLRRYKRPDASSDRLYQSVFTHPSNDESRCAVVCGDVPSNLVLRPERTEECDNPEIHYGLIASANHLMKDALFRDALAAKKDVLCFEMEAAGLMNHFPCLVIRGICDYSDTHKNKEWQGYAAMVAAAYAKDLLYCIAPNKVEAEKKISEFVFASVFRIETNVDILKSRSKNEEDLRILDWITPINYGSEQSAFLGKRQRGTGQWILDSVEYQSWLGTINQRLFCPGIPGAGKTILTSIIVNDLESRYQNDSTVGIAYVYCDFGKRSEQTAQCLLESLLKQLARSCCDLPDSVRDLHKHHGKKLTRPSLDEIFNTLKSVSQLFSRVFILIDAIDECEVSDGTLSTLLAYICRLQAGANVLVTSRPIPEIESVFKNCLTRKVAASREDVKAYIKGRLSDLPKFVLDRVDLQQDTKAAILSAANGMFLLAKLYIDSLRDKTSVTDMRNALKKFLGQSQQGSSLALDQAYEQTMERINCQMPGFRALGLNVLTWITCAKRLLTTRELQHALSVSADDTKLDKDNLRSMDVIVSVCAGLVTIDEKSDSVRLIHYTTQEYFEKTRSKWFPDAQFKIAKICTVYLSFQDFESGRCQKRSKFEKRLKLYPLYSYAAHNWGYHARGVSNCREILSFLGKKAQVEASTQALAVKSRYDRDGPKKMTGLHLVAYFGLEEAVNVIMSRYDLDARDSFGCTALWYAALKGHTIVVQQLLDKGADTEGLCSKFAFTYFKEAFGTRRDPFGTALLVAASAGYEAIVRQLLDKGANIEARCSVGQTVLSCAAESGHEAIVQLLLERGANILARDGSHRRALRDVSVWSALLHAAKNGHKAVVRRLLERGADIRARDGFHRRALRDVSGWSALLHAAKNGHEAVVRQLLDWGADTEVRDRAGESCESESEAEPKMTILSYAAKNGHENVVRQLLDKGANINARDRFGRTALWCAAARGHETVVRHLLGRGADTEAKGNYGGRLMSLGSFSRGTTALSYAARYGNETIVQNLLDKGANTEVRDEDGRTALLIAVEMGHETIILQLLNNGANIKAKDYSGRTALSYAAEYGYEAVVRQLLEKGADTEVGASLVESSSGMTALSIAAWAGYKAIAQQLLDNGADIDAKDSHGCTALMYAAMMGYNTVIRQLLNGGADIEAKDNSGKTALSYAAEKGHETAVQLLEPETLHQKRLAGVDFEARTKKRRKGVQIKKRTRRNEAGEAEEVG